VREITGAENPRGLASSNASFPLTLSLSPEEKGSPS